MKIALAVLDITLVGGIERVAANMSNMFAGRNDEVVICSFFKTNDLPFYKLDERVKVLYLSDKKFRLGSKLSMAGQYLSILRTARRAGEESGAEILVSLFTNISIIFCLSGRIKIPLVAAEHGQYYAHGLFVRTLRRLVYRSCAAVVSLSSTDTAVYKKLFGARARCIPNSIDRIPDTASSCEEKRCITIGRLVREKGYDRLVRMASGLFDDGSGWRLDIFGDGYEREKLESLVRRYRLDKSVSIRHFEKNIDRELTASSVYLCTSRTESFGMAIVEAMACGLPVVSFDCPTGPRDIIEEGVDGFLVPSDDEDLFVEKARLLMNDENLRTRMGSCARENARRYLPDAIHETWRSLFNEITGGRG